MAYGLADFLTRLFWSHAGWGTLETRISGAVDIIAAAGMMRTLGAFTSELVGDRLSPKWRWTSNLTVLIALVVSVLLFIPGVPWSEFKFQLTGLLFLGLLLGVATICGAVLSFGHRRLVDRPLRLWALSMGWMILAFVPLWFMEVFRVVQWGGFAWFFLLFNLAGLASMIATHIQPKAQHEHRALFEAGALTRCASRFAWTDREKEVANLHARGLSSTEIAEKLFIAPKTVRNHVANLYAKTGVHQRMALVELLSTS